ncbi:hypothetical protein Taro_054044 [Colocasia esculenta]|uniref:Uncharacterized protein n=1 Tax=Colocasia esculenta TaxID=4460 RepID=A0A843XMP9_COLES|nr:hypothetical protein [Colocasia esculenta]
MEGDFKSFLAIFQGIKMPIYERDISRCRLLERDRAAVAFRAFSACDHAIMTYGSKCRTLDSESYKMMMKRIDFDQEDPTRVMN